MSPLATTLCLAMLACGMVGVATAARMRHRRLVNLLVDAVMLAAMTDVCLLGSRFLAAAAWATVLVAVSLVSLVLARHRSDDTRGGVAVHALGLIATAAAVLMVSAEHQMVAPTHHGQPGLLAVVVLGATGVHVAMAMSQVRASSRSPDGGIPVVRLSVAALGSAVMGALAIVGIG